MKPSKIFYLCRLTILCCVLALLTMFIHKYYSSKQDALIESKTQIYSAQELINVRLTSWLNNLAIIKAHAQQQPIATTLQSLDLFISKYSEIKAAGLYYIDSQSYISTSRSQYDISEKIPTQWHTQYSNGLKYRLSKPFLSAPDSWSISLQFEAQLPTNEFVYFTVTFCLSSFMNNTLSDSVLNDGYLFIVDGNNQNIVFHPNNHRIGTASLSVDDKTLTRILNGEHQGILEYFYLGDAKIAQYLYDPITSWIYVSGTTKFDIVKHSLEFGFVSLLFIILLGFSSARLFLHKQLKRRIHTTELPHSSQALMPYLFPITQDYCNARNVHIISYEATSDTYFLKSTSFTARRDLLVSQHELNHYFSSYKLRYIANNENPAWLENHVSFKNGFLAPLIEKNEIKGLIFIECKSVYKLAVYMILEHLNYIHTNLQLTEVIATTDPSTKLFNRKYLRSKLHEAILLEKKGYVAFLDLDKFKLINDTYGHLSGDKVIFITSEIIRNTFKNSEATCARYGGEEFSIYMPSISKAHALTQFEALRKNIEDAQIMSHYDEIIKFTISIGVCELGYSLDHTLEKADTALYQAKERGRNRVVFLEKEHQSLIGND